MVEIMGQKYSLQVFELFSKQGMKDDTLFRFRRKDGDSIWIEIVEATDGKF